MYRIARRYLVSQDLLDLIKQLSCAVARFAMFLLCAESERGSSFPRYILSGVFDMERPVKSPTFIRFSCRPVLRYGISRSDANEIHSRREKEGGEEYVRNLVTVYLALIVAIIYVARPKFQVVRG